MLRFCLRGLGAELLEAGGVGAGGLVLGEGELLESPSLSEADLLGWKRNYTIEYPHTDKTKLNHLPE